MGNRLALLAVGLALASPAARGQPTPQNPPVACGVPSANGDGWPIATPASAGLDDATLCKMVERFTSFTQGNVHSVLVARRGALVFEQYFTGEDVAWGDPPGRISFGPQTRHDLRSVTKSVVSLLLGIAIAQGKVAGADAPVFDFFPDYADLRTAEKDRIRLRHLLTMSSGLAWDENIPYSDPRNSEIRMNAAPDPLRFVLAQPVVSAPGAVFNYSGGSTQLIGTIIEKATGKPLQEFAREALFEPLGIVDWQWVKYDNGAIAAASGLKLRPRDMLKIGQLVLARGAWSGRQVVPAAWIDASTSSQIEAIDFLFYGYQWWLGRSLIDGREVHWSLGLGLGGQRVFVVPALDLVVVITAGLYTSPTQRWVPWEIFRRHVVGAVRDGAPASSR